MAPNITASLQRLTGEWAVRLQPEAMLAACGEVGYTGWRDRVLTPVTTVQLFLLQILHGNTACSHLPHLSGVRFTAAAYCQARARLPVRFFALLFERFGRAVQRSALDDPTRDVNAQRGALPHRPPRLPNPPDHPGDHAPRRGDLPCMVPTSPNCTCHALADRDRLDGAPQGHDADGCVAL